MSIVLIQLLPFSKYLQEFDTTKQMQSQTKKKQLLFLQTIAVPSNQTIRLCTELNADSMNSLLQQQSPTIKTQNIGFNEEDMFNIDHESSLSLKGKIFDMYLYTQENVYFAQLETNHLNPELNWKNNLKFLQTLKQCLSGVKKNVVVVFSESHPCKLTFSYDYEDTGIKIMFFEMEMLCLMKPPLQHAKNLLRSHTIKTNQHLKELESQGNFYVQQMEKCQSMMIQLRDSHKLQINTIKNSFISAINTVKKKTRPFLVEEPQNERSNQTDKTESRRLIKIKKQPSQDQRESQNFEKLFQK